mmetsp:Transcript_5149/g.14169  ORF Transcript_5149/g.14169 Transcript_5149/m.14169 type:complete len:96 (+) Transcript_5149:1129-1416(+)
MYMCVCVCGEAYETCEMHADGCAIFLAVLSHVDESNRDSQWFFEIDHKEVLLCAYYPYLYTFVCVRDIGLIDPCSAIRCMLPALDVCVLCGVRLW